LMFAAMDLQKKFFGCCGCRWIFGKEDFCGWICGLRDLGVVDFCKSVII
jgi:hypothetical protein